MKFHYKMVTFLMVANIQFFYVISPNNTIFHINMTHKIVKTLHGR